MQATWRIHLTYSLLGCIAFLDPSSLQGFIPWYSTEQVPKVCSPEVQDSEFAVRPPLCPKDLELHYFMVTAAKAALELHIPHQSLLVGKKKVSIAPLLVGSSVTWRRKLSST